MKLEAVHPHNMAELCPATVVRVFNSCHFLVEIDSHSIVEEQGEDSTWLCTALHPYIFPPGWAKDHGLQLTHPKGWATSKEEFDWMEYLMSTKSRAAPRTCFHARNSAKKLGFSPNMKLEAVNPENNHQICVATIVCTVDHLLWLHLESNDDFHPNHIVSTDSLDIFPVGWCDTNSYRLKPPSVYQMPTKAQLEGAGLDSKKESVSSGSALSNTTQKSSWCPKIYFNHKCFSGPYLSKGKLAQLPKAVGPGQVTLVMKEVLSMLISVAYKSSRVLKELQSDGKVPPGMYLEVLKAKFKTNAYRANVAVITSADMVASFCQDVCKKLQVCPYLFGPVLIGTGGCPENCGTQSKTKFTQYWIQNKRPQGRPKGEASIIIGRPKKRGRKKITKAEEIKDQEKETKTVEPINDTTLESPVKTNLVAPTSITPHLPGHHAAPPRLPRRTFPALTPHLPSPHVASPWPSRRTFPTLTPHLPGSQVTLPDTTSQPSTNQRQSITIKMPRRRTRLQNERVGTRRTERTKRKLEQPLQLLEGNSLLEQYSLPTFSGKDHENPTSFLQKCEFTLKNQGTPRELWPLIVKEKFLQDEENWWKIYENYSNTWEEMCTRIKERLNSQHLKVKLQAKLYREALNKDESADQFILKKVQLNKRFLPNTPEEQIIPLITELLHPTLRPFSATIPPTSLDQLIEKARPSSEILVRLLFQCLQNQGFQGDSASQEKKRKGKRSTYTPELPEKRKEGMRARPNLSLEKVAILGMHPQTGLPRIQIDTNIGSFTTVIDFGASTSFIKTSILDPQTKQQIHLSPMKIRLAKVDTKLYVTGSCNISIKVGRFYDKVRCLVAEELSEDLLLDNGSDESRAPSPDGSDCEASPRKKYRKREFPKTEIKTRGAKLPNFALQMRVNHWTRKKSDESIDTAEQNNHRDSSRKVVTIEKKLDSHKSISPVIKEKSPINISSEKSVDVKPRIPSTTDTVDLTENQTETTALATHGLDNMLHLHSNPLTWTKDDVYQFLTSTDCVDLADKCKEQLIDGHALMLLNLPTIQEYLCVKTGTALKLCHLIEKIKLAFYIQYGDSLSEP
nr:unnamed protein product [Timema tahoe]